MSLKVLIVNGNKNGQKKLLLLTGILFVLFLSFLLFQYSNAMLLLVLIETSVTIYLNLLFSNLYDISIENQIMTFENLWRKKDHPLSELTDVRSLNFIFTYPFNPFVSFVFKNNEKMVTMIKNPAKIYLSEGGMDLYISNLKNELLVK